MLMKGLRTALVGIGIALSMAACASADTPAGRAPDVHVQRNSLDGVAVPSELAGALDDCLGACEAGPETCVATCCEEVTGSPQCSVD